MLQLLIVNLEVSDLVLQNGPSNQETYYVGLMLSKRRRRLLNINLTYTRPTLNNKIYRILRDAGISVIEWIKLPSKEAPLMTEVEADELLMKANKRSRGESRCRAKFKGSKQILPFGFAKKSVIAAAAHYDLCTCNVTRRIV